MVLFLSAGAPSRAADAPPGPDFLKGLANLVKLHDLTDPGAVSKALDLGFAPDPKSPGSLSVEPRPYWLTRGSYIRRTFPVSIAGVGVSLQLAPAAGCVKTEQVAAWLGHDYQLTPFYTTTEKGAGKVDARQVYLVTYRYPGPPLLRFTFQPDHDGSGCFKFIMVDEKL